MQNPFKGPVQILGSHLLLLLHTLPQSKKACCNMKIWPYWDQINFICTGQNPNHTASVGFLITVNDILWPSIQVRKNLQHWKISSFNKGNTMEETSERATPLSKDIYRRSQLSIFNGIEKSSTGEPEWKSTTACPSGNLTRLKLLQCHVMHIFIYIHCKSFLCSCVKFYDGQILICAAKTARGVWTLSLSLSSCMRHVLYQDSCTLLKSLFGHPALNISLPDETWMTKTWYLPLFTFYDYICVSCEYMYRWYIQMYLISAVLYSCSVNCYRITYLLLFTISVGQALSKRFSKTVKQGTINILNLE